MATEKVNLGRSDEAKNAYYPHTIMHHGDTILCALTSGPRAACDAPRCVRSTAFNQGSKLIPSSEPPGTWAPDSTRA